MNNKKLKRTISLNLLLSSHQYDYPLERKKPKLSRAWNWSVQYWLGPHLMADPCMCTPFEPRLHPDLWQASGARRDLRQASGARLPSHPSPTQLLAKLCRAERLHQDLHCTDLNYIDPSINVKLYDYIKLQTRSSSSSISPIKTSSRSTSTRSFTAADKNPAAAVIFDRRRRLRQDPPPP
jgi:hypothetical protein